MTGDNLFFPYTLLRSFTSKTIKSCYIVIDCYYYRCTSWLDKCNCKSLMPIDPVILNRKYRLCSLHFEEKMFSNYQKNRLKSDAIPTIFQNLVEGVPIVGQLQIPSNDCINVNNDQTPSCSTSNAGK